MKYRILVADDERMVRVAIRASLEALSATWMCCGEAVNGEDMVEQVRRTLPDLVLVDIKMPLMDGLSAIKICRTISPGTRFLVLSGVNDFDQACRALNLGVMDYLLKPVRPRELSQAVMAVQNTLIQQANDESARLTLGWQSDGLENRIIHGLYIFVDEPWPYSQKNLLVRHLRNVLPSSNRVGSSTLVLESTASIRLVLAHTQGHPDGPQLVADLEQETQELLKDWTGRECGFSLLRIGPLQSVGELQSRFQQLEQEASLRFLIPPGMVVDMQYLVDTHPGHSSLAFLASFDHLLVASTLQGKEGKECFLAALEVFEACLDRFSSLEVPVQKRIRDLARIFFGLGTSNQAGWARELRVARLAAETSTMDTDVPVIQALKSMVERDYMLDIGLKQASMRLGLSPNYLSTLFKRHTGESFVDYLTAHRIGHAKILLKDSSIPLKEIASMVGYANRSYFDKVFARATGQTPGEYRRSP